jgi:UDP-glucose 4-epimerase
VILVTGGAGYIGSHVTRDLLDKGNQVIVVDNLTTGHLEAIDKRAIFIFGDIGDNNLLNYVFNAFPIDAVMHFAASCLVEESVNNPLKYYHNNVNKTLHLISKMLEYKINKFIFSSTCATYGIPEKLPISEHTPTNPINPYGHSKLMIERVLNDVAKSTEFNYIALRYFNVAGAHISANIGEDHHPETHLIPNVLRHLQGKSECIEVYGNDHHTSDGTCIRDYIHVSDLSRAHICSLEYLYNNPDKIVNEFFNLGTASGYSILEIIKTCEEITGEKANIKYQSKRMGDPPTLIASSNKIKDILGWEPMYNLKDIIRTAWNWHVTNPNGYKK